MHSLQTIRDYIRYAATEFNRHSLYFGHGTDNAWDEACALVLHTLHLPHHLYDVVLDARITDEECVLLEDLIMQRIEKRIPLPYLTHEAWFADLAFYVDERVLVPRSPIAELIKNQFSPWLAAHDHLSILDVCTGSGCIAIACAHAFPDAHIDACDNDAAALEVAKINVARHHCEQQVTLYQSDLFASLPQKRYHLIVSNPPYVSATEMVDLPEEYKQEPAPALAAGTTGLDCAERILHTAKNYLHDDGILVLEVGNSEEALSERYPDMPFLWLDFENGGGGVCLLTARQLRH